MRRAWLALLALALVAAAGCTPAPPRRDELVFWTSQPTRVIDVLARAFERENPALAVRVVRRPPAQCPDSLAAALAAGRPPDLCEVDAEQLPALLASGALCDWSAGVAALRDSLRGWPACTMGDAIYGLPWRLDARVLLYDPALFRRAGLDPSHPPATWSALLAAATRIQKLRHGVHGYGLALGDSLESFRDFMPYAWGNGGEILSAGLDSSRFGSERNVAALRFYVSLRRAGLLAGRDTLAREFRAGRLGMLLASGAQVAAASPGPSWATALVPAPAADSAHVSLAGATVLVSFNAARHKEAAQRLARFLTRPRNALALAASAPGAEPAWVGVDTAACYRQHHARAVLLQQVANARFAPGHRDRGAVARAIAIEVEATLRGGKNAERAVADADARLAARTGRK